MRTINTSNVISMYVPNFYVEIRPIDIGDDHVRIRVEDRNRESIYLDFYTYEEAMFFIDNELTNSSSFEDVTAYYMHFYRDEDRDEKKAIGK